MPEQYEAIRDRLMRSGMSEKAAKTRAAKIYNSKNPDKPVGPNHDAGRRRKQAPGLADL